MKFLGFVLVLLGMMVVVSMAANPVPIKHHPQPHQPQQQQQQQPEEGKPVPIAELHKPASKENQESGSFLVDIPFKWIIIRTFTFTFEPVEDEKPIDNNNNHKMMHHNGNNNNHHGGNNQQHKTVHQDSFCLQFLEPARTECLMAVARNLEKKVEKQQAELETMAFLLENEVRFFGIQLTHFIFVVCFVFFLISIIRCLKRRRYEEEEEEYYRYEEEEEDEEDEEDEETPEPQQTVTTFNLSGRSNTAVYQMVPASEKAPPVLTPPSSVPMHNTYPGVVYPSQNRS